MLTTSLQNNCSKQQQTLPGKLGSVFEKDFTIDVLLYKKLRKAKIKASKGKKKIYNVDADAEISKWHSSCHQIYHCNKKKSMNLFLFRVEKNFQFHSSHSQELTYFHYKDGNTEYSALKWREFKMSLIPCLNLCSRRWQKPNRNIVSNFISTKSFTLKVFFWAVLINFNNVLLNKYTDWNCE